MSREKDVPEKLHAELGASVASRWMACPGSIQLSRQVPTPTTSGAAQEGTAAHSLAELSLTKKQDPDLWNGLELEGIEVDDDMVEHVRVYVDHCRTLASLPGAIEFIERKFNLGALNPPGPMFGTSDHIVVDPAARTLHVSDLKFGRGVVVEIKGNKQTRYYALGAFLSLPQELREQIDSVTMYIVQPRVSHPDGVIRSETISLMELIDFTGDLMSAAKRTQDPDAPLVAGNHCRFCPARPLCPENQRQATAVAQVEFAALPVDMPPAPSILPPEVLVEVLEKLPILEEWARSVRAYAQEKLMRGEEVPGFKLVEKRATRKWNDEESVAEALKARKFELDEIYTQKLKSPAQIEKLFGTGKKGKAAFEASEVGSAVVKVSSGVNMVPANDPRPAARVAPGEEFTALPSGEE